MDDTFYDGLTLHHWTDEEEQMLREKIPELKDADFNDCDVQDRIARVYAGMKDVAHWWEWLVRAAYHGNDSARCDMGIAYENGYAFEQSDRNAMLWFLQVSPGSKRYDEAQQHLRELWQRTPLSKTRKDAADGDGNDKLILAARYESGIDGKPDYDLAEENYLAGMISPLPAYLAARFFNEKRNDTKKARECLTIAYYGGYPDAETYLGVILLKEREDKENRERQKSLDLYDIQHPVLPEKDYPQMKRYERMEKKRPGDPDRLRCCVLAFFLLLAAAGVALGRKLLGNTSLDILSDLIRIAGILLYAGFFIAGSYQMLNEWGMAVCVIVGILLALFTLTQPLVPMAGALLLALVSLVLIVVHSSRVSNGKRKEKYLKEIIEPLTEQRRKDLIAQFREKYGEKPEL